jgi:ABC-type transport system involved in cytochrome bd biosynthesis fused ATPase/permease subunit
MLDPMYRILDCYEQLILLDEIAGELDEESNHRIDIQRNQLKQQIKELEAINQ